MANHLGPNRINEERAEAHMCRRGIVIRDSTRIRVGKKNQTTIERLRWESGEICVERKEEFESR